MIKNSIPSDYKILIRSYSMVVCIKLEAHRNLYRSSGWFYFKDLFHFTLSAPPQKSQLHLYESKSLVARDQVCVQT